MNQQAIETRPRNSPQILEDNSSESEPVAFMIPGVKWTGDQCQDVTEWLLARDFQDSLDLEQFVKAFPGFEAEKDVKSNLRIFLERNVKGFVPSKDSFLSWFVRFGKALWFPGNRPACFDRKGFDWKEADISEAAVFIFHLPTLHSLAARRLWREAWSIESRSDAISDFFVYSFEKRIRTFDPEFGPFESWFISIFMRHIAGWGLRNANRRARLREVTYNPEFLPHVAGDVESGEWQTEMEREWRLDLFRNAITKLNEPDRELVTKRIVLEMSHEAIALEFGISTSACRKRFQRATEELKRLILEEVQKEKDHGTRA